MNCTIRFFFTLELNKTYIPYKLWKKSFHSVIFIKVYVKNYFYLFEIRYAFLQKVKKFRKVFF
jgi:hypothetical protein